MRWRFEGAETEVASLRRALPAGMTERVSETILFLDFGNSVGIFDVPGVARIEVRSGKWGESDFESMLSDLTEISTALPFSSGDAAALPYDRSVLAHEEVLYHAFVYLRHVLLASASRERRLDQAFNLVLLDPHRRFQRTSRVVPAEQARRIDASGLARLAAARDGVYRAPPQAVHLGAARQMRGHLPERIEESVVFATHNTAENRFAKSMLRLVHGVIEGMRRAAEGRGGTFGIRIGSECTRMERLLTPIGQNALWREVGPMVHLPASSTVLQRRRGYRELFGHWARLRLATHLPLTPERTRDLLEIRDIAELYELWCFFSLVREVSGVVGPPERARPFRRSHFSVHVDWDFEVRWRDGTRLLYNPRFSRSQAESRYSYSVALRPDIALEVCGGPGAGLHLLDAKFKVDRLPELVGTDDLAAEEREERRGIFKRGDIYKMHTYRDAIPRARSVWILYPGTEDRFFAADGGQWDSTAELTSFDGVGALSLSPDREPLAVQAILRLLLGRV